MGAQATLLNTESAMLHRFIFMWGLLTSLMHIIQWSHWLRSVDGRGFPNYTVTLAGMGQDFDDDVNVEPETWTLLIRGFKLVLIEGVGIAEIPVHRTDGWKTCIHCSKHHAATSTLAFWTEIGRFIPLSHLQRVITLNAHTLATTRWKPISYKVKP